MLRSCSILSIKMIIANIGGRDSHWGTWDLGKQEGDGKLTTRAARDRFDLFFKFCPTTIYKQKKKLIIYNFAVFKQYHFSISTFDLFPIFNDWGIDVLQSIRKLHFNYIFLTVCDMLPMYIWRPLASASKQCKYGDSRMPLTVPPTWSCIQNACKCAHLKGRVVFDCF